MPNTPVVLDAFRKEYTKHPKEYRALDSMARLIKGQSTKTCSAVSWYKGRFLVSYNINNDDDYNYFKAYYHQILNLIKDDNIEQGVFQPRLYINLASKLVTFSQLRKIYGHTSEFKNFLIKGKAPQNLVQNFLSSFEGFENKIKLLITFLSKGSKYIKQLSPEECIIKNEMVLGDIDKAIKHIAIKLKGVDLTKIENKEFYKGKSLDKKKVKNLLKPFEDLRFPKEQIKEIKEIIVKEVFYKDDYIKLFELIKSKFDEGPEVLNNLLNNTFPMLGFMNALYEFKLFDEGTRNRLIDALTVCTIFSSYIEVGNEVKKLYNAQNKEGINLLDHKYKTYICRLDKDLNTVSRLLSNSYLKSNTLKEMSKSILNPDNFKFIHFKDGLHAEMNLVEYLSRKMQSREKAYIGITKLCCNSCTTAIEIYNNQFIGEIIIRGTHAKTYSWKVPPFLTTIPDGLIKFIETKSDFTEKIESHSSVNITAYEEAYLSDSDWESSVIINENIELIGSEGKEEI
ncbi:MAG: hypothetical protein K0Q51_713 [Rickettsiaceae bacterium]|jgi:hypothetical protein|nr:hypothetical protein [Rickettsiaceae bacterium]